MPISIKKLKFSAMTFGLLCVLLLTHTVHASMVTCVIGRDCEKCAEKYGPGSFHDTYNGVDICVKNDGVAVETDTQRREEREKEASQPTDVTFTPLVGLPDFYPDENKSLVDYVNFLYKTLIGLGALFAMVRIAYAGAKYSLDEIVTDKEDAKAEIKGVLLGLFILVIPYAVLNTINPNLTNIKILDDFGDPITKVEPQYTVETPLGSDIIIPGVNDATRGNLDNTTLNPGSQIVSCYDSLEECQRQCTGGAAVRDSTGNGFMCIQGPKTTPIDTGVFNDTQLNATSIKPLPSGT
jgi:hypothetical protein